MKKLRLYNFVRHFFFKATINNFANNIPLTLTIGTNKI